MISFCRTFFFIFVFTFPQRGSPVVYLVERWFWVRKVAGLNHGWEGPSGPISFVSALCTVLGYWMRRKTEALI